MSVRAVRGKRRVMLACGKCPRRVGAGRKLAKGVKAALKPAGVRLVRTRCLGLCPRAELVFLDPARADGWVLASADADPAAVAAMLVGEAPA